MKTQRSTIKGLVFGGIMAALAVACAVIPLLGLFIPIPLVLTYVRFGGRTAGLAAFVATIFAAVFMGPVRTLLLVPGGILPGLVFGYGFRRRWRPFSIALVATTIFFVGVAADYMLLRAALGGRDPITVVLESDQIRGRIESQLAVLEQRFPAQLNAGDAQNLYSRTMDGLRQNPGGLLWGVFPTALFIGGAAVSGIIYGICRFLLVRFGHSPPEATPFTEIRLPQWTVFSLALSALALGVWSPASMGSPWWLHVPLSMVRALSLVLVPIGMAVAFGFLRRKELPTAAASLLAVVGLFFGAFGIYVYVLLAVWDSVYDLRGLGHGLRNRTSKPAYTDAPELQEGRGA